MSRTFFNELGSIEVVARLNSDLPNDIGVGMIGDMSLLHIEQSLFFGSKRNDQEEECLKSSFKHARLQNKKSDKTKTKNFVFIFSLMLTSCIITA